VKNINVIVVGPSATVRGGISTLIANIKDKCTDNITYHTVATHTDTKGSDESQVERRRLYAQARVYFVALLQVLIAIPRYRNKVFHVHLSQEGSTLRKGLICVLLRIFRCRYLIHTHAAEDKLFHPWVSGRLRSLILWGFRGCRYCLALTPLWADYYADRLSLYRDQVLIMPNPADIPATVPDRSGRDKLKLLFLGRLGERKGVFDLIRAFAALPDEIRHNCQLTLAGDGEVQAACAIASLTGCKGQVTITGWIDRIEVTRLLAKSDALVLPSYAEGMSLSVLEAMAWGLPVVTTRSGGSTSYLENHRNCLLVEPGDVAAITEAIQLLYEKEETRLALGREARQTAEFLSIDRYVERLSLIYRDAAGRAPSQTSGLAKQQHNLAD
jgi:glycosyltransferase involved in cell wall biosynthesis